jgi:hypothetical protein
VPQRIYVHAGKTFDYGGLNWVTSNIDIPYEARYAVTNNYMMADKSYFKASQGAVIGEVDITGCVEESDSPWFTGIYGFTLVNPVLYEKPIPCKGKLNFFELDI